MELNKIVIKKNYSYKLVKDSITFELLISSLVDKTEKRIISIYNLFEKIEDGIRNSHIYSIECDDNLLKIVVKDYDEQYISYEIIIALEVLNDWNFRNRLAEITKLFKHRYGSGRQMLVKYSKYVGHIEDFYNYGKMPEIKDKEELTLLKKVYDIKKNEISECIKKEILKNWWKNPHKRVILNVFILIFFNVFILKGRVAGFPILALNNLIFHPGLDFLEKRIGVLISLDKFENKFNEFVEEYEKQFCLGEQKHLLLEMNELNDTDAKEVEENSNKDFIINNIREDMEKINKYKYKGYQEHLNVLYELAVLYLDSKSSESVTQYDILTKNSDILEKLIKIEEKIEDAIKRNKNVDSKQDILKELAELSNYDGRLNETMEDKEDEYTIKLKF